MRRWMSWGFLTSAILIHILFITSLWTGILNPLFHDTKYILGQGADFFAYYQAGYNVLNGLSCYLIPDPLVVPYLYPYRYLPYFAYSFGAILNIVPPITAYWLWVGVVTVSVWLAIIRTRTLAKSLDRPDWERRIAMGIWLVFSPIYIELFLGQVTLMAGILMFYALTTSSFVEGKKTGWTTTVSWLTGGLTKLIPFFIAPVLLGAGRVRTVLVAFTVTILAIVLVPAGLESLQFFLDFNTARNYYISRYAGSHSLKMLILYLLGLQSADFSQITGLLMGFFFMLAITATLYSRDVWSCTGLFVTTYFFIMTDVWEHHYTFILPLLVLAWIRGRPEDKARWVPVMIVLLMSLPMMPIVSFLSGNAPAIDPMNWAPIWLIVYHSSKVVPTLIFCAWLLVTAFRSPRENSVLWSIENTFRNVWNGLVKNEDPTIEGGVLVRPQQSSE